MPELRITELDFAQIKQNLQTFMSSQTEFTDYDFTGSGLSILLDVLAYNTHYNALLAHFQSNELFIDTAIKRASVVSIAKTLGYIPRSATSARAKVRIVVTPVGPATVMTIGPNNSFTATSNGEQFTFQPVTSYTTTKQNGVFTFENVTLVEGTILTNSFVVSPSTVSGPFVIPVDTVDVSSMTVDVFSNTVPTAYRRANTIVDVGPTNTVFWVEEATTGKYQIVFGDDIIGKTLTPGSTVRATYIACSGSRPNGARVFSANGAIAGETAIVVTTINPAASGDFREGIDEIRRNAPRFNATRNRVVTASDYKTLILAEFSRAKSVVVWGGEENTPPVYGKVYITLDPKDGEVITDTDKDFISDTILRPRSVMSIQHEFVDPDYAYLGFTIQVRYNERATSLTAQDIENIVRSAVDEYFTTYLQSLERGFIYSQFVDFIQNAFDEGVVVGILIDMSVQRRLNILLSLPASGTANLLTAITPETLKSTTFQTTVNEVEYLAFIRDRSTLVVADRNGTGVLELVDTNTLAVLQSNVGMVEYRTGQVYYSNIIVNGYIGEAQELRLTAQPQVLGQNINTTIVRTTPTAEFAVRPTPSVNTILLQDDSVADASAGLIEGVRVTATPQLV
jgi:hypothetical protein